MQDWQLEEITEEKKTIIENLLQYYFYELSVYFPRNIQEDGKYRKYTYLETYFKDSSRKAYFIKVKNQYAGFVFVNEYTVVAKENETKAIAEFFVLKQYRGEKLGTQVALNLFKGEDNWEVKVLNKNKEAMNFWKNVITENYTQVKVTSLQDTEEDWTVYNFSGKNVIQQPYKNVEKK